MKKNKNLVVYFSPKQHLILSMFTSLIFGFSSQSFASSRCVTAMQITEGPSSLELRSHVLPPVEILIEAGSRELQGLKVIRSNQNLQGNRLIGFPLDEVLHQRPLDRLLRETQSDIIKLRAESRRIEEAVLEHQSKEKGSNIGVIQLFINHN